MSQKKRELDQWEKDECAALKEAIAEWNRARPKSERITQEQAGEALGMNQGSFSNYLNGRTALNLDFAFKVKVLFGIPVEDFSPRLAAEIREKYALIDGIQQLETERTHEALNKVGGGGNVAFWTLANFFDACKEDGFGRRRDFVKRTRDCVVHSLKDREGKVERLYSLFYSIAAAELDGQLTDEEVGILSYLVVALDAKYDRQENLIPD
ncbi:helix-turn-helix transcriptional regulator [Pseudomonas rossensis]|uniref:helix-turn-helix transcriptional regulator n=1 Tax=Pseudomonas rossensis TaxID=2305471 RepID=UPI00326139D2